MIYRGREATPGTVLAFGALLCLLLVNISIPITHGLYFIDVTADGVDGYFRVGLWGWCANIAGNTNCSSPRIGFTVDTNSLPSQFGESGFDPGVLGNVGATILGYLAVSHILALGLTLISFLIGLIAHHRSRRRTGILRKNAKFTISGLIAGIFALIIDLILFEVALSVINKNQKFHGKLANAFWLLVSSLVLLILSILTFMFGQKTIDYQAKKAEKVQHHPEMSTEAYLERLKRQEHELQIANANKPVEQYAFFEEDVVIKDEDEDAGAGVGGVLDPGRQPLLTQTINTGGTSRPLPVPPLNPSADNVPTSNEKYDSPYPPPATLVSSGYSPSTSPTPYSNPVHAEHYYQPIHTSSTTQFIPQPISMSSTTQFTPPQSQTEYSEYQQQPQQYQQTYTFQQPQTYPYPYHQETPQYLNTDQYNQGAGHDKATSESAAYQRSSDNDPGEHQKGYTA